MSKQEFLAELEARLFGLPQDDIGDRLAFYSEIIDDRMEEGLSEEDAVSGIGSVDEIASQIVAEVPFVKIVKEKIKPKRTLKTWEIVLLVLGSPIWVPLLIAAFAVIFAAYIVVWSLIVSLLAIEVSAAACSLAGIFDAFAFLIRGNVTIGIAMLGAGTFFAGLAILLFFGRNHATQYTLCLTKKMALGIKSLFIGKEDVK